MNMNEQKIFNLLSMAQRAGRIASGDFAINRAVQEKKARLLLVARDASGETKKSYRQMALNAGIELFYIGDRELLGHCIGKDFRAAAAVLDAGFANAIAKHCRTDSDMGVD